MGYGSGEDSGWFMPNGLDTLVRDRLARQRTELANERTLLAYIRTALGFVIVGVPAIWLMEHPSFKYRGGCLWRRVSRCCGSKLVDTSPPKPGLITNPSKDAQLVWTDSAFSDRVLHFETNAVDRPDVRAIVSPGCTR
jgi:hypothetical protein